MERLTIIGSGGHGLVAAETAEAMGVFAPIEFADDRYPEQTKSGPWPVTRRIQAVVDNPSIGELLFSAVGDNATRAAIDRKLGFPAMPQIVHPTTSISRHAKLGDGTLAVAGVVVNINARIGRCVILNTACSIDHDCELADYVHVSPGARLAGGVCVGTGSWIGIGAVVREGIAIGKNAVVGAGSVVVSDVADGEVVFGVPAGQRSKRNER